MEDMASKLSALLSSPEGMQTLMNMASALGLGATPESPGASQPPPYAPPWNAARQGMGHNTPPRPGQQPPQQPPGPPPPQPPPPGQQAQPDLNGIASMLGGMFQGGGNGGPAGSPAGPDLSHIASALSGILQGGAGSPGPAAAPAPAGPDLSNLAGMLGGMMSGGSPAGGGPNLGNLAGMLGGMMQGGAPAAGMANGLDMNMIFGLQRAMATMNNEDKNVTLLRSLRPIFSEARQKKVDDAIRIMQLIKLLPLIKETGLFGGVAR